MEQEKKNKINEIHINGIIYTLMILIHIKRFWL